MIKTCRRQKFAAFVVGLLLYVANLASSENISFTNRQFRPSEFFEKFILKKEKYAFAQPSAISAKETSDNLIIASEKKTTAMFSTPSSRRMSDVQTAKEERETEIWATTISETKTTSDLTSASAKDASIRSTASWETEAASETKFPSSSDSTARPSSYSAEKYGTQSEFSTGSEPDYSEDCGMRIMRRGRILGGEESYPGKWPWHVLIVQRNISGENTEANVRCGGVLISPKYVITAAHCGSPWSRSLELVLGAHDRTETEKYPYTITRYVRRVIIHHRYYLADLSYDLALYELNSPVDFLPHIRPICLARSDEDYSGKMAFVTGWGFQSLEDMYYPRLLQEVEVPILTEEMCKENIWFPSSEDGKTDLRFLCAGYPEGGKSFCNGDSGGPLMVQGDDGRWVLVGIVSHSFGCALPNHPGIYMSVPYFRSWIDSVVFDNTSTCLESKRDDYEEESTNYVLAVCM